MRTCCFVSRLLSTVLHVWAPRLAHVGSRAPCFSFRAIVLVVKVFRCANLMRANATRRRKTTNFNEHQHHTIRLDVDDYARQLDDIDERADDAGQCACVLHFRISTFACVLVCVRACV